MTPCPKPVQYVAVSWTARPVTQMAEVAVKRASPRDAPRPSLVARGSVSSSPPSRMTAAKPRAIIWAEENGRRECFVAVLPFLKRFRYR